MSNNISSNISTRESVSSILESSIRELSDVVNSASDSDPSINDIADVNPIYSIAIGTNSSKNMTQSTMIFFVSGE